MCTISDQQNKQLYYQTLMDHILNNITKAFDFGSDITFALKNEKPYDMDKHKPVLKLSTAKSNEVIEVETRQFELSSKQTMPHTQSGSHYMKLISPKLCISVRAMH
jgi:hypothetical protein